MKRSPTWLLRCRHAAGRLSRPQTQPRRHLSDCQGPSSTPPSSTPRPTSAPKPMPDIKHMRQNATLYEQTCIERNYPDQAAHAARIADMHERRLELQRRGRSLRERSKMLGKVMLGAEADARTDDAPAPTRQEALDEAKRVKERLTDLQREEAGLAAHMTALALELPNLTDPETPRGAEPVLLRYINEPPPDSVDAASAAEQSPPPPSHVDIGDRLGILDFAAAAASSGWGWYYLVGEAAQLEQALVQYALQTAARRGWTPVSPPTLVYDHVAAACGFQPRDQHGEQQIYAVAQSPADAQRRRPPRVLAATSEIALAAMAADRLLPAADLPRRRVAVSRCYRAEAGARGGDTKGLYRVHEFTKVELFAWTAPDRPAARALLDDMVALQADMLAALALPCRVLAMPAHDLGASASFKIDIEAYFPSRSRLASRGWGELTSASLCTDYQARRLATRTRSPAGDLVFPYTVNATALAVPRVLAALLEHGWDEDTATVAVPECLRPWMDGKHRIGGRN